jgi:hypothetical protein
MTAATGNSLSIYAQEPGSTQSTSASWFCGFNYVTSGLTAALVGAPSCTSYDTIDLTSATMSMTADGVQLTVSENGIHHDRIGVAGPATFSGVCARN